MKQVGLCGVFRTARGCCVTVGLAGSCARPNRGIGRLISGFLLACFAPTTRTRDAGSAQQGPAVAQLDWRLSRRPETETLKRERAGREGRRAWVYHPYQGSRQAENSRYNTVSPDQFPMAAAGKAAEGIAGRCRFQVPALPDCGKDPLSGPLL